MKKAERIRRILKERDLELVLFTQGSSDRKSKIVKPIMITYSQFDWRFDKNKEATVLSNNVRITFYDLDFKKTKSELIELFGFYDKKKLVLLERLTSGLNLQEGITPEFFVGALDINSNK